MLLAAMALPLSASSAQSNGFDHRGLSSLSGYAASEEDNSWRYEQYYEADKGDIYFGLGFVAEQENGKELDAPWAWVEYIKDDAAKTVDSIELKIDSALFRFSNLDLASDGSYATWNLGRLGQDMLTKLRHAKEIRVTVAFDAQSVEVVLTQADAAGIIRWADSILSSALFSYFNDQLMLAYDTAYSPQVITLSDQGIFDQTQLNVLEGYMLDETGAAWRYERLVERQTGSLYFGLGFVADGYVNGPLNYPWAWVAYHSAGEDDPISRINILVDDALYDFSSLKIRDGYSCWTLGWEASTIAEKLIMAQTVSVKIYFGDYIKDFRFGIAALEPLRTWGSTVTGTRIFSFLDQNLLNDLDDIYREPME